MAEAVEPERGLIGAPPPAVRKAVCQVCRKPATVQGVLWQTDSQRALWIVCDGKKGCGFNGEAVYQQVGNGRGGR